MTENPIPPMIPGQVLRIDWPSGSSIIGVAAVRGDGVHLLTFGQAFDYSLQLTEVDNSVTPVLIGATLTTILPEEPTGYGAIVSNQHGHRYQRNGDMWVPEYDTTGMSYVWAEIAAVAVLFPGI